MSSAQISFTEKTTIDEDGIEWIGVKVISTNPPGAIVKWVNEDGGVIAECADGDCIEVVVEAGLKDAIISITKAIEE